MLPTALVVVAAISHGDATRSARLLALYTASNALAGPLVGGYLDRIAQPTRHYRIALGITAGSITFLGVRLAQGWASVIAVGVLGVSGASISGAWSGALGRVVGSSNRFHAWDVATYCVASTSGPLLASSLALIGTRSPFLVGGALAVSALSLSTLMGSPRGSRSEGHSVVRLGRALRYVLGRRRIRTVVLFSLLVQFEGAAIVLSAPALADRMAGTVGLAGLLVGGLAVGALLASLLYSVLPIVAELPDWGWALLFGSCGLVLAWVPSFPLAMLTLLVMGCCNGALLTTQFALAGREAPDGTASQVFAVSASMRTGALSIGTLLLSLPALSPPHDRLPLAAVPMVCLAAAMIRNSADGTRVASDEP